MKPVAWLIYKGGELYAIRLEKDDRGDFYTWKPLYTADQLREVEQQRDELAEVVSDAIMLLTNDDGTSLAPKWLVRAQSALSKVRI